MRWNRGAELLFGYTAEEAVGKSITILIPADRHNAEPMILERVRRGESVDHYETVRQRKDGSLIDISLTVSPIKNEKCQIVAASKIARDITESKRSQTQQELLLREMDHRVDLQPEIWTVQNGNFLVISPAGRRENSHEGVEVFGTADCAHLEAG
jgi:PAS domain S-box-containing protein